MILDKEQKNKLYEDYLSQKTKILRVDAPNGMKLLFNKTWDYKDSLKNITFKSINKPSIDYKDIDIETINLMPISNFTYYQITIKR